MTDGTVRRRLTILAALSLTALTVEFGRAQQATVAREPASKAAVVLTWNQAEREAGFAGMERIFLTRTVRAGSKPYPLGTGRPLEAFATGGARASAYELFIVDQKVAGVIVLHENALRHERYELTGGPQVRSHSFSIAK